MSEHVAPESRAEVLRIAGLMGLEEADIAFLGALTPETLLAFRHQLIEVYFGENASLGKLAKVANMMPSALIAKVTVDAIGPILAARVVGEVDTKVAIGVLKRVPINFLVDTAIAADPRRVIPLFAESPTEISKAIADELIVRKEYVAIGQLIAYVENEVMEHALGNASDLDILYSSFLVEEKDRLADGIAMLDDTRILSLVKTASKENCWLEALDLMSHLEADEFRRVVSQAMKLSPKKLSELLEFVEENELWYVAIPALCLADQPKNGVAAVVAAPQNIRDSVIAAFKSSDYSEEFEELLGKIDDPALREMFEDSIAA
jgi:hypothetical protein